MEEMKPATDKMVYRYLGNTGLKVSVVGFGNWVNNLNDEMNTECFKKCLEHGINYFDTAEGYGMGKGENIVVPNLYNLNKSLYSLSTFFLSNIEYSHCSTIGGIKFNLEKQ